MSRRRTVRSLAALAAVLGVAASGCSDPSAKPKPLPSATATASGSASASPTAPSMPPEASGTSAASAKAFVRFWTETLNYAGRTGDVDGLRRLSDDGCKSCQAVIQSIETVYKNDGYYKGDGWTISTLDPQPLQPRSRPVLSAGIHIAPQVLVTKKNAAPKHFKGGNRSMIFRLLSTGDSWTVLQLDQPS